MVSYCSYFIVFTSGMVDDDGWIVWLRRVDNTVSFDRDLAEYKRGFGNVTGNYWMGLDQLHCLTNSADYMMRVDTEGYLPGENKWFEYRTFKVGNEQTSYRLTLHDQNPSSTLGGHMFWNTNMKFTTRDVDNDRMSNINCADQSGGGGFWYNGPGGGCSPVTATSPIGKQGQSGKDVMHYYRAVAHHSWGALKTLVMKMKLKN